MVGEFTTVGRGHRFHWKRLATATWPVKKSARNVHRGAQSPKCNSPGWSEKRERRPGVTGSLRNSLGTTKRPGFNPAFLTHSTKRTLNLLFQCGAADTRLVSHTRSDYCVF